MKIDHLFRLCSLLLLTMILFQSCLEDECNQTDTYIRHVPVYKTLEEIRQDIVLESPRSLENPGNIYYYKNFLLINERQEGIHVIDNTTPSSPQNLGFIVIPGNLDMAIKNDILYADMYIDLVSIDISNPMNPQTLTRELGIFDAYFPQDERGFIVEYREVEETIQVDCSSPWSGRNMFAEGGDIFILVDASSSISNSDQGLLAEATGTGGSMARFTISGDHLYTLDDSNIETFDIGSGAPSRTSTVEVDWSIETIFPYEDKLFIGGQAGMYIYSLENPGQPEYRSEFVHARACDPVYVSEDIAYVTLRNGNACRNFINQLEVLDVSDINNPVHLHTYPMHNPHGLSVIDDRLYLCEGDEGLKIFDVSDLDKIAERQLFHDSDPHAYDMITLGELNLGLLIGQDGLYQYDITDRNNPIEISKIPVNRP